jgi:hypothetical protein
MKNIQTIALIFLFFFSANVNYAEDNNKLEVPEGMEAIAIGNGGGQFIVPKGAKIKRVGPQIIVEDTNEYMARMVQEMTERLSLMEQNQEELKQEIETLKKSVEELQKKSVVETVK